MNLPLAFLNSTSTRSVVVVVTAAAVVVNSVCVDVATVVGICFCCFVFSLNEISCESQVGQQRKANFSFPLPLDVRCGFSHELVTRFSTTTWLCVRVWVNAST